VRYGVSCKNEHDKCPLIKPILAGSVPTNAVIAATGVRADEGIWLVLDPQNAGYFPIRATNSEITAGAQLEARPRLVIGQKPDATSTPLPQAGEVPAGNSFFIVLPIEVGYAPISQALRDAEPRSRWHVISTHGI